MKILSQNLPILSLLLISYLPHIQHMMLKKGQLILVQKKQGLRRVVECLFLSKAGPKKWVFVISDSNYRKRNVGCVANVSNFCQI